MPDHLPGCSCCGTPLDPTDLDVRTGLPDAILELTEEERATVWGDGTFQRLAGVGAFLRCLMPVRLTGGSRLTYSVWLRVEESQLKHAYDVWNEPAYLDLTLTGTVANAIAPWPSILGENARAEVREEGTLPYLVAAEGTLLHRVLSEEWDRDDVLSRLGYALPVSVRDQVTDIWSIERTAGLTPHPYEHMLRFVGPGRTVQFEPSVTPPELPVAEVIARVTEGAPAGRDGERTEQEGGLLRYALWSSRPVDGRTQYEFFGFAAVPGRLASVTVMYDDPDDLAWAESVWRSVRATVSL